MQCLRVLVASLAVALSGCNLVAYDILAAGRDLTPADGGASTGEGGSDGGNDGGIGVDPCASFNGGCDARATCERDGSNAICRCPTGYQANGKTCVDVNECLQPALAGCDTNAKCINETGSFRCECKTGYSGDGKTCADVDECAMDNGGCDVSMVCTNTVGSRTCDCPLGYGMSGSTCVRTPWPKVGDLPAPMSSLGATVWKDRLYVVDGNGPTQPQDRAWMASFLNDGRLGPFTVVEKSPNGRQNHCLIALNNVMYMIGGSDITVRDEVLYSTIASDGTLAPWAKTKALPSARTMVGCLAVNGRLYVFGGGYSGHTFTGLTDVLVTTPAADGQISSWTPLTTLPEPVVVNGVGVIGNRVYVRGENPNNPGWPPHIFAATLLTDGTFDTWQKVADVPNNYASHPLVTWGQQLHIGAGRIVADVDASGVVSPWNIFYPEFTTSADRAAHASVIHNGRIYLIGGNTLGSSSPLSDIRTELIP